MKSDTCFGKASGTALSQFVDKDDAQSAADYAKEAYNNELAPYKCSNCDFWHLSPASRLTPSKICNHCTASNGSYKDLYETKKAASLRADIILEEHGIFLNVYRCKYNDGWHLTKINA